MERLCSARDEGGGRAVEYVDRTEKIEDLVRYAEGVEDPREVIEEVLEEMARAVIEGDDLDTVRLRKLAMRFATAMRSQPTELGKVLAGLRFVSNVESYERERRVVLGDGRTATRWGWREPSPEPRQERSS